MSVIDAIRYAAIAVSILVIIAGMALLFMSPSQLEGLFNEKELPVIEFATLTRTDKPNSYLLCPADRCPQASPDDIAPVFDLSSNDLRARLLEYVDRSPDIRTHRLDLENQQFEFVERTPMMRFPDIITVRIYPTDEGGSTLAIYSRSVYGHSDLGANKKRITRWLAAIAPNN
ncbi:hypothetical protein JCM17844_07200 [Iodidimonas gelatinilytica]|uniref:DUF1499 domain-containing protein n=1 Tax=Iodidimonas gelatinilytica TaxID=1236966 RepID=A0A5A7MPG6_9PROT|nr:DUF1499 domain-containing protein [Iodidimonas gelatinilytica]GEQ97083.1 hypothetical protein JCM17844_07200 [Iodidimonas gelatinilytica]GEQ99416.1 hypothetical protein JCM17845_00400 [Iodidimonas gelatinilytica]